MHSGPRHVVVVGCGAIGLPLAVAFAARGLNVLGVDTDPHRLAALREGRITDRDEGLGDAFKVAVSQAHIAFASSPKPCPEPCAFIITVPTPVDASDVPLMANLESAVVAVAVSARDQDLITIRSTVPIGTTRWLAGIVRERGRNVSIVYCPDRSVARRSFLE